MKSVNLFLLTVIQTFVIFLIVTTIHIISDVLDFPPVRPKYFLKENLEFSVSLFIIFVSFWTFLFYFFVILFYNLIIIKRIIRSTYLIGYIYISIVYILYLYIIVIDNENVDYKNEIIQGAILYSIFAILMVYTSNKIIKKYLKH